MTGRVGNVEGSNPLNEPLHSPLLKQTHQRRSQSLSRIRGNLCNSRPRPGALLDVAARHLSKLQVSCDIGRDENVGQLAAGHEEFGNEINVPVVDSAVLLPWLLALVVVSVLLEELDYVRGLLADSTLYDTYSLNVDGSCLSAGC